MEVLSCQRQKIKKIIIGRYNRDIYDRLIHNLLQFIVFKVIITLNGEGDGTPLQCSCLENPMDGGAWWAAVHGVAKS